MDPNNPDTYLEIKPKCPFCGGDPEWGIEWNGLYNFWYVFCQEQDECGARSGRYGVWDGVGAHATAQERALAMWSKRTSEAQAQTEDVA